MGRRRWTDEEYDAAVANIDYDTYIPPEFPDTSEECSRCEGTGRVRGIFVESKKCRTCGGTGWIDL